MFKQADISPVQFRTELDVAARNPKRPEHRVLFLRSGMNTEGKPKVLQTAPFSLGLPSLCPYLGANVSTFNAFLAGIFHPR